LREDENMLLAVDVGNSETVVGLFQNDDLEHYWRLTSLPRATEDELSVLLHALLTGKGWEVVDLTGMAVCSVVPEVVPAYRKLGAQMLGRDPLVIDHEAVPDLPILNHDPATVGADRLANAVAVIETYGAPAIVVDLGTATTFDVVSRDREYAGGVISPGISTSANALFQRGARLARVEIRKPSHVVGRSTEESMQSGIFFGAVGGIDSLVRAVVEEQGFDPGLPVVATGGLASAVAGASETITNVDETLTLTGIRLIWDRQNR
jgi:type III pantothenate kinase